MFPSAANLPPPTGPDHRQTQPDHLPTGPDHRQILAAKPIAATDTADNYIMYIMRRTSPEAAGPPGVQGVWGSGR